MNASLIKAEPAPKTRGKNGFTLIEISAVLVILAVLITAAMVGINPSINSGNTAAVKQQIVTLEGVARGYAGANSGNPYGPYYGLMYSAGSPYYPLSYNTGVCSGGGGVPNAFGGCGSVQVNGSNYQYAEIVETNIPATVGATLCSAFNGVSLSCSAIGTNVTIIFQ